MRKKLQNIGIQTVKGISLIEVMIGLVIMMIILGGGIAALRMLTIQQVSDLMQTKVQQHMEGSINKFEDTASLVTLTQTMFDDPKFTGRYCISYIEGDVNTQYILNRIDPPTNPLPAACLRQAVKLDAQLDPGGAYRDLKRLSLTATWKEGTRQLSKQMIYYLARKREATRGQSLKWRVIDGMANSAPGGPLGGHLVGVHGIIFEAPAEGSTTGETVVSATNLEGYVFLPGIKIGNSIPITVHGNLRGHPFYYFRGNSLYGNDAAPWDPTTSAPSDIWKSKITKNINLRFESGAEAVDLTAGNDENGGAPRHLIMWPFGQMKIHVDDIVTGNGVPSVGIDVVPNKTEIPGFKDNLLTIQTDADGDQIVWVCPGTYKLHVNGSVTNNLLSNDSPPLVQDPDTRDPHIFNPTDPSTKDYPIQSAGLALSPTYAALGHNSDTNLGADDGSTDPTGLIRVMPSGDTNVASYRYGNYFPYDSDDASHNSSGHTHSPFGVSHDPHRNIMNHRLNTHFYVHTMGTLSGKIVEATYVPGNGTFIENGNPLPPLLVNARFDPYKNYKKIDNPPATAAAITSNIYNYNNAYIFKNSILKHNLKGYRGTMTNGSGQWNFANLGIQIVNYLHRNPGEDPNDPSADDDVQFDLVSTPQVFPDYWLDVAPVMILRDPTSTLPNQRYTYVSYLGMPGSANYGGVGNMKEYVTIPSAQVFGDYYDHTPTIDNQSAGFIINTEFTGYDDWGEWTANTNEKPFETLIKQFAMGKNGKNLGNIMALPRSALSNISGSIYKKGTCPPVGLACEPWEPIDPVTGNPINVPVFVTTWGMDTIGGGINNPGYINLNFSRQTTLVPGNTHTYNFNNGTGNRVLPSIMTYGLDYGYGPSPTWPTWPGDPAFAGIPALELNKMGNGNERYVRLNFSLPRPPEQHVFMGRVKFHFKEYRFNAVTLLPEFTMHSDGVSGYAMGLRFYASLNPNMTSPLWDNGNLTPWASSLPPGHPTYLDKFTGGGFVPTGYIHTLFSIGQYKDVPNSLVWEATSRPIIVEPGAPGYIADLEVPGETIVYKDMYLSVHTLDPNGNNSLWVFYNENAPGQGMRFKHVLGMPDPEFSEIDPGDFIGGDLSQHMEIVNGEAMDLYYRSPSKVGGIVRNPGGVPVAGATIKVYVSRAHLHPSRWEKIPHERITAADGTFLIDAYTIGNWFTVDWIPGDNFRVRIEPPPSQSWKVGQIQKEGAWNKDLTDIDFTFQVVDPPPTTGGGGTIPPGLGEL